MSTGTQAALAPVVTCLGGYWLDEKFGTLPWIMLTGLALGAMISAKHIKRLARDMEKE